MCLVRATAISDGWQHTLGKYGEAVTKSKLALETLMEISSFQKKF